MSYLCSEPSHGILLHLEERPKCLSHLYDLDPSNPSCIILYYCFPHSFCPSCIGLFHYPYNTVSMHSPQCLCTSYFFCLECSTPQLLPWLVSSLHSGLCSDLTSSKKPSLAGLSKILIPSFAFWPLLCFIFLHRSYVIFSFPTCSLTDCLL